MSGIRGNTALAAVPGGRGVVTETPAAAEAPFRAALGQAMELAPDGVREVLATLLRESMGIAGPSDGPDLLAIYEIGRELQELDALLLRTRSRRDQAAAVDAWLNRPGETDRFARLGRYLAALDTGHSTHQAEATRLGKLARTEKARRELLRERLEEHLAQHGLPSLAAGDYLFQVIAPKRSTVRLLVPADRLPEDLRAARVEWEADEEAVIAAYERGLAARDARLAEIATFVEVEGVSQAEAEAMFPAGADEEILHQVRVEERTGRYLRVTARRSGARG